MTTSWFIGIDPGSSKAWPVFCAAWDRGSPAPRLTDPAARRWDIKDLDGLVGLIAGLVREGGSVLLALDAPINSADAFAPMGIAVPGTPGASRYFPFDVHPFSTRPCEKALTGRVQVVPRNLLHRELVNQIGGLCGWTGDYRDPSNVSFVKHPGRSGVSVLGYMGAPHGPVVRSFLTALGASVPLVRSVRAATNPEAGKVYVLESHPAVAMAFWARYGQFGMSFPIDEYKDTGPGYSRLAGAVSALGQELLGAAPVLVDDDDLDSFVGLLNVVELATGRGTWFGTDALGYFLVPRARPDSPDHADDFGEVWERARARALAGGS